MASWTENNFRQWSTFWSTITPDGTRYRHQVRRTRNEDGGNWLVRTEVWPDGKARHYTASVGIPESQGRHFFYVLRKQWSNVDEEGREMYPPEYQSGFLNLGERNAE